MATRIGTTYRHIREITSLITVLAIEGDRVRLGLGDAVTEYRDLAVVEAAIANGALVVAS